VIVTREIDEFTIDEAKELVEKCVASERRDGFEFLMLVNKSAALFRNGDRFGLVLGLQDGVQAGTFQFEWIVLRSNVVLYETTLAVT
jgi:hypothetical protein